jgi:DNA-binding protein HU-beta
VVFNKTHVFFNIYAIFSSKKFGKEKEADTFVHAKPNSQTTTNNNNMNKQELIDSIADHAQLTKADAKNALDAFIGTVSGALKKGDRIALVGFGSFSISERSAREGRNPQTGKTIKIAAKKVVKFKAGAELAEMVNKKGKK